MQCLADLRLISGGEGEHWQQFLIFTVVLLVWQNHLNRFMDRIDLVEIRPHAAAYGRDRSRAKPGGILVLVIPAQRLNACADVLAVHFRDKALYRLTEPEAVRYRAPSWDSALADVPGPAPPRRRPSSPCLRLPRRETARPRVRWCG